jgi:hypothetical protein
LVCFDLAGCRPFGPGFAGLVRSMSTDLGAPAQGTAGSATVGGAYAISRWSVIIKAGAAIDEASFSFFFFLLMCSAVSLASCS